MENKKLDISTALDQMNVSRTKLATEVFGLEYTNCKSSEEIDFIWKKIDALINFSYEAFKLGRNSA